MNLFIHTFKLIMKNILLLLAILFAVPAMVSGQNIPDLGANASLFTLFTGTGALTNSGTSVVNGTIGTNNAGAYAGFTPGSVFTGTAHINNSISIAAQNELAANYIPFPGLGTCDNTLTSPLAGPQTLVAGIYCIGEATTITGDLILDAELDPSAEFIIKIGGALTLATSARIVLLNGTQLANVYFQVDGAVNLNALSVFQGTVVSSGAITLFPTSSLYGRALTPTGAITVNSSIVGNLPAPLPVTLTSFELKRGENQDVSLFWTTTQETNSDRFEIENSANGKQWTLLGSVKSHGETNELSSYTYAAKALQGMNFYRLKMIDLDDSFAYSRIRSIEVNQANGMAMFPNPAISEVNISTDNHELIERIQFNDLNGRVIYDQKRNGINDISKKIDTRSFAAGLYVVQITDANGQVKKLKMLKQ